MCIHAATVLVSILKTFLCMLSYCNRNMSQFVVWLLHIQVYDMARVLVRCVQLWICGYLFVHGVVKAVASLAE